MTARSTLIVAMLSTMLLASCAARSARIAELRNQPNRYDDKTVRVTGTVTKSWGIPFFPYQLYQVDDGSGEITVVSRSGRAPSTGSRIQVKGRLNQLASFGTENVGLHLEERDRKFR
jgi:hypothetical protein